MSKQAKPNGRLGVRVGEGRGGLGRAKGGLVVSPLTRSFGGLRLSSGLTTVVALASLQ